MFNYTLRLQLPPTLNFEERLFNAIDFCEKAKIDEVMFFIGCEELNTGHITIEEAKPYVDTIKRASEFLKSRGIRISLNPWMTIGHYDGGKTLKKGQNFGTLVGDDGETSSMTACPLSQKWREYYVELLNFYVENLKPEVIWFEDDFRMEAHRAKKVIVQGCFCDEHMQKYNAYLGTDYDRETFVKLLASDLKARKAFLDVTREATEQTLKFIVDNVKGQKRFGLMTGSTSFIEGRRFKRIFDILSSGGRETPLNRLSPLVARQSSPQLAGYLLNKNTMIVRALSGDDTEFVTEMENNPHTMYTKSANFCRFQMLSAVPLLLSGATFSIFEFNGNGAVNYDRLAKTYSEIKPYLSAVEKLGLKNGHMRGVKAVLSEDIAYYAKIGSNDFLRGYHDQSGFIFATLETVGVACVYTTETDVKGETIALSGQVIRALDKQTVKRLFADNFVILMGEGVETLFDLGLNELIGAKSYAVRECRQTPVTMEQICGNEKIFGISKMRATSNFGAGNYVDVVYDGEETVLTDVLSYEQKVVGKGMVAIKNALIVPYLESDGMPFALFNPLRELLVKRAIKTAEKGDYAFIKQENVSPYLFYKDGKTILLCVNYCDDDYEELHISINKDIKAFKAITVDEPNGFYPAIEKNGEEYVVSVKLKGEESLVLIAE